MQYLKYLLLVPFLYGFISSADSYYPSCPSGKTQQIKQHAKDKCISPARKVPQYKPPECKTGGRKIAVEVGNLSPLFLAGVEFKYNWAVIPKAGRDICIHKYKDEARETKCPSGYTLVINGGSPKNSDTCVKYKTEQASKTTISCNNPSDKHKKKGRDVCQRANF